MTATLHIEDYGELIALYRALMMAKFPKEIVAPELPGSPFLASVFERLVEVLVAKEVELGKPNRASNWHMELNPKIGIWEEVKVLVVEIVSHEKWILYTRDKKRDIVRPYISPFTVNEENMERLISEIDLLIKV